MLGEGDLLPLVDPGHELLDGVGVGGAPEDALGLETLGLLEELHTLHHHGRDLAVLVVKDPLQGYSKLK